MNTDYPDVLLEFSNYVILNPYILPLVTDHIFTNRVFHLPIKPYYKLSTETRQQIQNSPKTEMEAKFDQIQEEILPNTFGKILSPIRNYDSQIHEKQNIETINSLDTAAGCNMIRSAIKFNLELFQMLPISDLDEFNLYHTLFKNDSIEVYFIFILFFRIIVKINEIEHIIPPQSSFILCDIQLFKYINYPMKYDLMILDPPWQSMSVSRSKSYTTLTLSILEKYLSAINPSIILDDDNGIVGIWITNDPKIKQWVLYINIFILIYIKNRNKLFSKWNVEYYTTFYWVKLTSYGVPVIPFSYSHRLPYERLLIGYKKKNKPPTHIPKDLIIFSTPISHSFKPNPISIFQRFYKHEIKGVEYFSRQLKPNWLCVGNEVLYFQNRQFYEKNEKQFN